MLRRRLSYQLALILLLVALVPLAGVGLLTLHLLERSITDQVRASHDQMALAAGSLVRDYLKDATTKLKSIAHMIQSGEDPNVQARRLNALIDPPGIFLEVSHWQLKPKNPELNMQVQQRAYSDTQYLELGPNAGSKLNARKIPQRGRVYDQRLGQNRLELRNDDPMVREATLGNLFNGIALEVIGDYHGLPISVPAPGGAMLTAMVDFRLVSEMLSNLAGSRNLSLRLFDGEGDEMAASGVSWTSTDLLEHRRPVGHGNWTLLVAEPRAEALEPLRQARLQALLWFGLACVMVVCLATLFSTWTLRPVRALARAADAFGRGDYEARSGVSREDEIGQLAAAFDRMAAAVQQVDQLKDEFLAHVSHELRTPLTSAKMALANVQEGLAGTESLQLVRSDLDRLIRMVNELLDAARIEAGIELAKRQVDLGTLVRDTVETVRPIAPVPIEVSGSGATVEADPARVQQIVLNLVDNALKHADGRVTVEVEGREIRVSDDGSGVPEEARERIFEKFGSAESGPKPPGSGLGLWIARKLADLHGGSLICKGNVFILRL